jgi:hypothetical protein
MQTKNFIINPDKYGVTILDKAAQNFQVRYKGGTQQCETVKYFLEHNTEDELNLFCMSIFYAAMQVPIDPELAIVIFDYYKKKFPVTTTEPDQKSDQEDIESVKADMKLMPKDDDGSEE